MNRLSSQFKSINTVENSKQVAEQDVVFLALYPQAIPEALKDIKGSLRANAIIISLAPKPPITKLSGMLGGSQRIARPLPCAPSIVNKGYNPVVLSPSLS